MELFNKKKSKEAQIKQFEHDVKELNEKVGAAIQDANPAVVLEVISTYMASTIVVMEKSGNEKYMTNAMAGLLAKYRTASENYAKVIKK